MLERTAMDVAYPLMVVGTAERHIQIFNLNTPTQVFKTLLSPLRWQTRVVRHCIISFVRIGADQLSC